MVLKSVEDVYKRQPCLRRAASSGNLPSAGPCGLPDHWQHSSLLTDTSYAVLFSHSVSLSFFVYSRLWTRPQIWILVPTENPEANRDVYKRQVQGAKFLAGKAPGMYDMADVIG